MWSKDFYNPITDTTITRKWVVSQTNPWTEEENRYNYMEVANEYR